MAFALDALLTALGLSPGERPVALRITTAVALAAPGVLWWLAPFLAGLPGFGWLADRRPLSLSLDESGLGLRRGEESQFIPWNDVSRVLIWEGDLPGGRLVLRDGRRVRLPGELVIPRLADGERTTLLDEIDRYRPELAQVVARRRQEKIIRSALLGVVVALGVVGTYLLWGRR